MATRAKAIPVTFAWTGRGDLWEAKFARVAERSTVPHRTWSRYAPPAPVTLWETRPPFSSATTSTFASPAPFAAAVTVPETVSRMFGGIWVMTIVGAWVNPPEITLTVRATSKYPNAVAERTLGPGDVASRNEPVGPVK